MWLRASCRVFGNATLQQEGLDLIDDASVLTDQPLTHPVERLQIELLGGCRDELHCWAADRLGIPKVMRPLEYGRTYFAGISRACPSTCSLRLR
jgi:hypothetical protein